SRAMADMHFWIGTFGILLYVVAMWVAGITEGLMQRAETADGLSLQYPSWVEIVSAVLPMYMARSLAGGLFIFGWILMIVNLWKTMRGQKKVNGETDVRVLVPETGGPGFAKLTLGSPVILTLLGLVCGFFLAANDPILGTVGLVGMFAVCVAAAFKLHWAAQGGRFEWHRILEGRPMAFTFLVVLALVAGGIVELLPGIIIDKEVPRAANGEIAVMPYTALELEGRDVYVREGCYVCHSQMIRPFRSEKLRYGDPSRIEESMWDHPFQWGSKRTGPDLARVGGTKDNLWHYEHMIDPRSVSPDSNMPSYPWLLADQVDLQDTPGKLHAMQALGVPYSDEQIESAVADYQAQAQIFVDDLAEKGRPGVDPQSELVALIAYLQRLGKNLVPAPVSVGSVK
ncbi:MAG: cytochrome-c oxidase, cbb3-type subunit II, partial [Planctomycetota bacterium]